MDATPYFLLRLILDENAGERDIRRAYARELKLIDQETDAENFQSLRETYELALAWVGQQNIPPLEKKNGVTIIDIVLPYQINEVLVDDNSLLFKDIENIEVIKPQEPVTSELFSDFVQRFNSTVRASGRHAEHIMKRDLVSCFEDPKLVDIAARYLFEENAVKYLLEGYKLGNESLMQITSDVFNWSNDKGRLMGFGISGEILNQAIDERTIFSQQYFYDKEQQRALIDRLRNPKRPNESELIKKIPLLETILLRYPTLIPIIVDIKNIQQWQEWANEIPDLKNRIAIPKTADLNQDPDRDNIMYLLVRLVLACGAFWWVFGRHLPFG